MEELDYHHHRVIAQLAFTAMIVPLFRTSLNATPVTSVLPVQKSRRRVKREHLQVEYKIRDQRIV